MRANSKRLFSFLMVLVLVVSCLPAAVFATSTPDLPTATVTEIENKNLTFAMNFKADEVTEEQLAYYGDWYADFVLTINKEVTFNANGNADGYLSGQYDAWSVSWVDVPGTSVTLAANEPVKIMEFASGLLNKKGLKYTFREVYNDVKDFDCGIYFTPEFLGENADLVVTLELRAFDRNDESISYRIGDTYTYTNPAVVKNAQTGLAYDDVKEAVLDAAEGDKLVMIDDAEVMDLSVYENMTLDLNGHTVTAKYATVYGTLVDNSADNSGRLIVSPSRFMFRSGNKQLPVYTGEGFCFVDMTGFNTGMRNANTFAFQPLFETYAHQFMLSGAAAAEVSIQVEMSWIREGNVRKQSVIYNDDLIREFIGSARPNGGYNSIFTLTIANMADFENLAFTAKVVSSAGVELTSDDGGNVQTDGNGQMVEAVTLENGNNSAVVAKGTKVEANAKNLTLTTTEMSKTTSNITAADGNSVYALDVHVEGIAKDNTVPVIVTLEGFAGKYMNEGNIALYHVENGVTNGMTRVYSLEELDAHNEYYYDIATGVITVAMATFSEITLEINEAKPWNGDFDYSWYDKDAQVLTIANADQLAAFGKIVGGMAEGIERDSFEGKTVKLICDINLDDAESDNDESKIFYPIGYYFTLDKNADGVNDDVYSTVYNFKGVFDGTGHTIANFYQNTWEMDGDYNTDYPAGSNYYKDAMGLFGFVRNGVVKNLTVKNFSSDGEFTPTGVIAAYSDGESTFENISIFNCNPRVYNTGNGGIIGWDNGGDTEEEASKFTFRNITIDNSNKISALWGSWDVACGGVMGYLGVHSYANFEDCHIAAVIDVNNDVCANYQYYWYRYSGMLIGTVDRTMKENGYTVLDLAKISATNTTVNFGDWNNYYYCELVANSLASYTHDHQFSRLVNITDLSEIYDGTNWLKTGHYAHLDAEGKIIDCYHILKDEDGKLYRHLHKDSGKEDLDKDGVLDVDKEDKCQVNLPFNQVFGGYGWGVKGTQDTDLGITVQGITSGDNCTSHQKFESAGLSTLMTDRVYKIGEIFKALEGVKIRDGSVQVAVTAGDQTFSAVYVPNAENWAEGTLTLTMNEGMEGAYVHITIQDYFYCEPTTIGIPVTDSWEPPIDRG